VYERGKRKRRIRSDVVVEYLREQKSILLRKIMEYICVKFISCRGKSSLDLDPSAEYAAYDVCILGVLR
jgi:hypothetical protein